MNDSFAFTNVARVSFSLPFPLQSKLQLIDLWKGNKQESNQDLYKSNCDQGQKIYN
jgi:hypothetical protein